jgi:hypothetical protein
MGPNALFVSLMQPVILSPILKTFEIINLYKLFLFMLPYHIVSIINHCNNFHRIGRKTQYAVWNWIS